MTAPSDVSPIILSQGNDIASANKSIIETNVVEKRYYNYYKRIIKNTTTRFHYTTETLLKLTVTSMNCNKSGFHSPCKTILSNGINLSYPPNKSAQISNWFTRKGRNKFNF